MSYVGDAVVDATPMSVKELAAKAAEFDFNPGVSLRYWLRIADTIEKEVRLEGPGFVALIDY